MNRGVMSTPPKGGSSSFARLSKSSSSLLLDGDTSTASTSSCLYSPSSGSSVQVAVRVRPISEQEKKHGTLPVITASTADKTVTVIKGHGSRQAKSSFAFDNVFTGFSTQEEVFEGTLKPVISYVLKGFESTVFAYGQTGTGKTYTMEGELHSPEQQGVIPRAAHEIFNNLKQSQYKDPVVTCSYLEIYNEDLCDLLVETDDKIGSKTIAGDNAKRSSQKLEIMESKTGTFCRGLSEKEVSSAEDVLQLMQNAQHQRHIGETKMNKQSSRSHCIFTIRVHANLILPDGGGTMEFNGKLHMVDLAGSECARSASFDRPNSSDAARERERMNINRSLLTLGRVISLLKESGESKRTNIRIPYRDSKLTRILQESLGGRTKTVIIATLSPSITAIEESMSTLNYAQSALGIVNKPISSSFLSLNPGQSFPSTGIDGDNSNSSSAVEYWHDMECRLQYMQAQVEESQAALARKHLQQQELVERAEKAASERDEAQTKLEEAKKKITLLTSSLVEESERRKEIELKLQKSLLILNATKETERRLTSEAKALLSTLETSIFDGNSLYSLLKSTFESEVSKRRATKNFHSASRSLLKDSLLLIQELSSALENHCHLISTSASEIKKNTKVSSTAVGHLLDTITEQIKSIVDVMTKQVSGEESLNSIASEVSSNVLRRFQIASSTIRQGEAEMSSTCTLARTRLIEVSEQLIALGTSHESLQVKSLSSLDAACLGLKGKLHDVMNATERAIKDAEVIRKSAHAEQERLISHWTKDVSDACVAISAKAGEHSERINHVIEAFSNDRKHQNLAQRTLEDQKTFLAETGTTHISNVSQQESLILTNEKFLQDAHRQQRELRAACVQNIMSQVQDIVTAQMLQLSHATEKQFDSIKSNNDEMKRSNACIADSSQCIFSKVRDENLFVSQQIEALQKSDSSMLQVMHATSRGLENVAALSNSHHHSSNNFSSQIMRGLDNLSDLDREMVEKFKLIHDDGKESAIILENSLHPDTACAIRSLYESGDRIVGFSYNSIISPTIESIDSITQPRSAILEHMKRGEDEITNILNEQHASFSRISELHQASGESGFKKVSLLTSDYQTGVAKENAEKMKSLEQNLLSSISTLSDRKSNLLDSLTRKTVDVKAKITDFSSKTLKMDENVSSVPDRPNLEYSKCLSHTPSEDEICSSSKQGPPSLSTSCNSNLLAETTIDSLSSNDGRLSAENKENNNSDTASVKSSESTVSCSSPLRLISNIMEPRALVSKWAECTGSSSRAPKDSSSNNKRQHPVSGAKRTILSRMDGKSNGTPQRVGRKKSKYASSPTRSTPNSRLK